MAVAKKAHDANRPLSIEKDRIVIEALEEDGGEIQGN